jgi:hypothetical protein
MGTAIAAHCAGRFKVTPSNIILPIYGIWVKHQKTIFAAPWVNITL